MLDGLTLSLDTIADWTGYPKLDVRMGPQAVRSRVVAYHLRQLYPDRLCSYCGAPERMTADHVRPKSKHPGDSYENIVPACHRCNNEKGSKSLLMFLWGRAA